MWFLNGLREYFGTYVSSNTDIHYSLTAPEKKNKDDAFMRNLQTNKKELMTLIELAEELNRNDLHLIASSVMRGSATDPRTSKITKKTKRKVSSTTEEENLERYFGRLAKRIKSTSHAEHSLGSSKEWEQDATKFS